LRIFSASPDTAGRICQAAVTAGVPWKVALPG